MQTYQFTTQTLNSISQVQSILLLYQQHQQQQKSHFYLVELRVQSQWTSQKMTLFQFNKMCLHRMDKYGGKGVCLTAKNNVIFQLKKSKANDAFKNSIDLQHR